MHEEDYDLFRIVSRRFIDILSAAVRSCIRSAECIVRKKHTNVFDRYDVNGGEPQTFSESSDTGILEQGRSFAEKPDCCTSEQKCLVVGKLFTQRRLELRTTMKRLLGQGWSDCSMKKM